MQIIISLIIIVAVVYVLFWLIDQINFGPPILPSLLKLIVVIAAIMKVWPML